MLRPSVHRPWSFFASLIACSCTLNDPTTRIGDNRPVLDAAAPADAAPDAPGSTLDSGEGVPSMDSGEGESDPVVRACEDGTTRRCGPSTEDGMCSLGLRICEDGVWGECVGAVEPAARDCRSEEDRDCDGQPDNLATGPCACVVGTTEPCDTHPGLDGVGSCKAGVRACEPSDDGMSSAWGPCVGSVGPAEADSCAVLGNDADCDGTPNEGCACVEGELRRCGPPTDEGICAYGTSKCEGGQLTACTGATLPAERDCSARPGIDNDCDGSPDNLIDSFCTCVVGQERACNQHPGRDGNGPCREGVQRCVFGTTRATSVWGPCEGAVGPGDRNCASSEDNDCDGRPDDTLDAACACRVGAIEACDPPPAGQSRPPCRAGERICTASADGTTSSFGACIGAVGPALRDSCAIPNDDATCDGVVNGGCECVTARGNADCSTRPAASVCTASGLCAPCLASADCALVPGRNVCSSGVCVQCTPEDTRACAAGEVCQNQQCVTPPVQAVGLCGACVADLECGPTARCVAPRLGTGTFCFPLAVAGACSSAPFGAAVTAISASGGSVDVCLPRATTCQALADFDVASCPVSGGVGDATACGVPAVDDGICLPLPAPASAGRCSVPCLPTSLDCPRGSCVQGACTLTSPAP